MKAIAALSATLLLIALGASPAHAFGANSDKNLRRATAAAIGNTLSDDVSVYEVKRGALSVRWKAKAPSGSYVCEADDMVRSVNCVKVAEE